MTTDTDIEARRREALMHGRILDSMRDGVVTIDLKGRIVTFNAAAGRMLGLDPADVIGARFGEVFVSDESFDTFNEVIFNAIFEGLTTDTRDVTLEVGGRNLNLFVSTSFLTVPSENGIDAHRRLGVVIVFSDVTESRKRRKIKRLFGAYVDPRIVERLLERSEQDAAGRRGRMTIAFTDLRDFTGWTERLEADTLIELLNTFLSAMAEAVSQSGGITDKFIGDAVMACWGAPYTAPETEAADACAAALRQIRMLPDLRAQLAQIAIPGADELDATIGIATGEVIVGDVGSPSNRNYTVVGHAANLAARLQELAKEFGVSILVSERTQRAAGEAFVFRKIDRIVPRGTSTPEDVFALLGTPSEVGAATHQASRAYAAGLAAMQERRWIEAERLFSEALSIEPGTDGAALMGDRARRFAEDPPPEDWDGVFRMPVAATGRGASG